MFSILATLLLAASTVSAHGDFLYVTGSSSKVSGQGLGTEGVTTTGHSTFYHAPRFLGSRPQDATCGANRRNGGTTFYGIDWKSSLAGQIKKGLPVVGSDGVVTAQFFQVNRDGAGPFTCEVSTDATGKSWTAMQVLQNIPGTKGISTQFQRFHTLKAKLPSNTKCSGSGGACLVRCKNANTNPFGGCMAVKQATSSKKRHKPRTFGEAPAGTVIEVEERSEVAFDLEADGAESMDD